MQTQNRLVDTGVGGGGTSWKSNMETYVTTRETDRRWEVNLKGWDGWRGGRDGARGPAGRTGRGEGIGRLKREDIICIFMVDSRCCMAEINTTL